MFKVAKGEVPEYVSERFTPLSAAYADSGRESRGSNSGNFRPPALDGKTEWGLRRSFSRGVYLWNSLPEELKSMKRIGPFKCGLRDYLKSGHNVYKNR